MGILSSPPPLNYLCPFSFSVISTESAAPFGLRLMTACLHHTGRERVMRAQTSQIELVIDFDESRRDGRGWCNGSKADQCLTSALQFAVIGSACRPRRNPPTSTGSFDTILFSLFPPSFIYLSLGRVQVKEKHPVVFFFFTPRKI